MVVRFFCVVLLALSFYVESSHAQLNTLNHYDVLPEMMAQNRKPNILIIFDTSASMRKTIDDEDPDDNDPVDSRGRIIDEAQGGKNAADWDSRSYIAREAMRDVFGMMQDRVNLGLMVYDAHRDRRPDSVSSCSKWVSDENWGKLLMDIRPFDQAARAMVQDILDVEGSTHSRVERSDHCTPISSTIYNAYEYLVTRSLPQGRNGTDKSQTEIHEFLNDQGAGSVCPVLTEVILVTDGPSSAKNPLVCGGGSGSNHSCSVSQVERLYSNGIKTHVIGFGEVDVDDGDSLRKIRELAAAGSGTVYEENDDGTPASPLPQYYAVQSGEGLVEAFATILSGVYSGSASGTSALLDVSSSQDIASIIQASFQPVIVGRDPSSGTSTSVSWAGSVRSLFVDEFGYLREDGNQNGALEDYNTDPAIRFSASDESDGATYFDRLNVSLTQSGKPLEEPTLEDDKDIPLIRLNPIWDLSRSLGLLPQDTISTQRTYTDPEDKRRFLFTSVGDVDSAGVLNEDVRDFVFSPDGGLTEAELGYFSMDSIEDAEGLVHWTRGLDEDGLGLRTRTLAIEAQGSGVAEELFLLGDVVHSSPIQIGEPSEVYDVLFGDDSYARFKSSQSNRRSMVYVGSNSGILHGVNAGQFDSGERAYSGVGFDLGFEMWGYIPRSLLPHLRFFSDPEYNALSHVYGVDGGLTSFDVKIEADEWRTYLVATTGYGGFEHTVLPTADGSEVTLSPSVIIIDVTNPDDKPRLVAEIALPDAGAITSKPVLVKTGSVEGVGEWSIAFGTGVNNIKKHMREDAGGDDSNAKIFLYNLSENSATLATGYPKEVPGTNGGFVGQLAVADWNLDYEDDAVYFGVSKGDKDNQSGKLLRLDLLSNSISTLIEASQSFVNEPYLVTEGGNSYVFIGTGRSNSHEDFSSTEANSFYGVRESFKLDGSIDASKNYGLEKLIDVTGISVLSNGQLQEPLLFSEGGQTITIGDYAQLRNFISSHKLGWVRNHMPGSLEVGDIAGIDSSERVPGKASSPGLDLLTYTVFDPLYQCVIGGSTDLYTLNFLTGTAHYSEASVAPDGEPTILPTSQDIDGGVLVSEVSFPRIIGLYPPSAAGSDDGNDSPAPPGCSGSQPISSLCLGSDGTSPECSVVLPGTCGLGRNSWKEIDFRY